MESITIAKPYAKALTAIAAKNNNYDNWEKILNALVSISKVKLTQDFLNSKQINNNHKINLITKLVDIIIERKLNNLETNFIKLLITNHRINISVNIAKLFITNNKQHDKNIDVISAYGLSTNEQNRLVEDLSKKYKRPIILNLTMNEALIGGVVIKDDDKVIDMSIKARIQKLNACLSIN